MEEENDNRIEESYADFMRGVEGGRGRRGL